MNIQEQIRREAIKSMMHGKQSRKKSQYSAMYDVFNWCPQPQPAIQYQQDHQNSNNQTKQPLIEQKLLDTVEVQSKIGKPKKQLKPHLIQKSLYIENEAKIRRTKEIQQNSNSTIHHRICNSGMKKLKLNEEVQEDRKIIDNRKSKIKEFKYFTRDLPNSAFTTYYGQPAFESYGRCNSTSQLKTHNVMPHRGQNHPSAKQTYESALIKGDKIKISDHLPRKSIQTPIHQKNEKKQTQIINLPLQKPDLINHVRFSQPSVTANRKQAVPSTEQLRKQIKQKINKNNKKCNEKGQRKHQKGITEDANDGLKFMNCRQNLIGMIELKKTRNSRIAYKVTECYPENALSRNRSIQSVRPIAGLVVSKGDKAGDVIHHIF